MHLFPNNPYLRKVSEFCLVAVTCGIAIRWIDKQFAHQNLSDEEFENIILRDIQEGTKKRIPAPRFYNVGRPARLFRWLVSQEYVWVDKHRRCFITREGAKRLAAASVIIPPAPVDITNTNE